MSFVQRRRFLWILFLAGLALLAAVANATTLSRLRFEELANQATAVARLRCLGVESKWENGEIWTETRFEMVTPDSALAPLFDPRTHQFRHGGIRNLPVAIFQLKLRKALEEKAL